MVDVAPSPRPSGSQPSVIYQLMQDWSARLKFSLQGTRTKLVHSGDRGYVNEATLRQFLRENLSPRYRVGQGEVIDHHGNRSRQTDVVIADEEQPFRIDDDPQLLIIEGVAAAGEVKTRLTAGELRNCVEKGRDFKALEAVLGKAVILAAPERDGVPNSDLVRFYRRRPFFVFAYEGDISEETLLATVSAAEQQETPAPPIDGIFILDTGFALNLWDGNGGLSYQDIHSGQMIRGWITVNEPDLVLVWLLFWMNAVMPRFSVRSSPMLAYLIPGTSWAESSSTSQTASG